MNAPLARGFPHPRVVHRGGRLELGLVRCGARTRIGPQFASYPFHLTRSFDLDPAIPELTTLYLQSSSGGLYGGERLTAEITVGEGAAVHVTSQAATIVHDAHGQDTVQDVALELAAGSFLAYTPDPLVLFPGARLSASSRLRLAPGAVALLTDAIADHRLAGDDRPFDRYESSVVVTDEAGRLLVSDRMSTDGKGFARAIGAGDRRWTTAGAALLLGAAADLPPASAIDAAIHTPSSVGGVTALPNGAGYGVRILAARSGALREAITGLFGVVAHHRFGASPVARRK